MAAKKGLFAHHRKHRANNIFSDLAQVPWYVKRTTAGTSWAQPVGDGAALGSTTAFTLTLLECSPGLRRTWCEHHTGLVAHTRSSTTCRKDDRSRTRTQNL